MRIRLGFDIGITVQQDTPLVALMFVNPDGPATLSGPIASARRLRSSGRLFRDGFGNYCVRLTAPTGKFRMRYDAIVEDDGEPDAHAPEARETPVAELPDECLPFLLGSRYCETDHLSDLAWSLFGSVEPGWPRVQAICDYVHHRLSSAMAMPARRARRPRPTRSVWGCAATSPIWRSRSAAA